MDNGGSTQRMAGEYTKTNPQATDTQAHGSRTKRTDMEEKSPQPLSTKATSSAIKSKDSGY